MSTLSTVSTVYTVSTVFCLISTVYCVYCLLSAVSCRLCNDEWMDGWLLVYLIRVRGCIMTASVLCSAVGGSNHQPGAHYTICKLSGSFHICLAINIKMQGSRCSFSVLLE